MRNSTIDVRPLSLNTGAEIHGVDLTRSLSEPTYLEILNALHDWGVVFFRDQEITPQQHLAFAQRFGEVYASANPAHTRYIDDSRTITQVCKEPDETRNVGGNWHTDQSFVRIPPLGSILVARELPERGGDTMFASMASAYDSLSDGLKQTLEGLSAFHAKWHCYVADPSGRQVGAERQAELRERYEDATAVHPVVIRHPESGRKVLYVNPTYTVRFDGWTEEESAPLLDYLYRHAAQPENTCRFHWEAGSVAFWDNRSTWHLALNDYDGMRRLHHRIAVKGSAIDRLDDG